MLRIYFIAALLLFSQMYGGEYGLFAKRESSVPITNLMVFSERCSGSNFILSLIRTNLQINSPFFCHKHFPPWFELPPESYLGNPKHYHFEGTEDYLFVIIFRDPYDWVRSLHLKPWHASRSLIHIPFEQFIRLPWTLSESDRQIMYGKRIHPLLDLNPLDGKPFKNVFELRTAKIQNMLMIKERAKNVYYVNYETARDHPEEVLEEIGTIFGLTANPLGYTPVVKYKGMENKEDYKEKSYLKISENDLIYINSQLSEEIENKIGYRLIHNPDELMKEIASE